MAGAFVCLFVASLALEPTRGAFLATDHGSKAPGAEAADREAALMQTWNSVLGGIEAKDKAKDTPVTRVVSLLKEMTKTLQKEADEDEALYDKLACWCNTNQYEKDNQVEAARSKIAELDSSIESLTAKSAGLKSTIKDLEAEVAANKATLAEAVALREKQQKSFHGEELDSIQAIENLKAALEILAKHHGTAAPWMQSAFQQVAFQQVSLSQMSGRAASTHKDFPWSADHKDMRLEDSLDAFMEKHGFADAESDSSPSGSPAASAAATNKFLQQGGTSKSEVAAAATEWSSQETAALKRAVKSAFAFMQSHHSEGYYPSYHAQSGEIVGVLQELKEEMEAELSDEQKTEMARAADFAELREAKTAEIENGERMAESKEDELAETDNALAEAKEDLGQEKAALNEFEAFLVTLKMTCSEAADNFQKRKLARLEEIKAVGETIEILTEDEARDAMSGTFNFLQLKARSVHGSDGKKRQLAAQTLRQAAQKAKDPTLSVLATSVELDAFAKVKKAIDDMIVMLKKQQDDEVKKNDWCKGELQENEMTTSKTEDKKNDLTAQAAVLDSTIKDYTQGVQDALSQISQLQLDLQRASEDRLKSNLDFQKTVADQFATVAVLEKALNRLATYYDKKSFVQTSATGLRRKEPISPVGQMEYQPNKGAAGVMQIIEKLIYDAKGLTAEAKKSEVDAQNAYEATIRETNSAVSTLQKEVTFKTKAKAQATGHKLRTENDIADRTAELEGLAKYNADLHADCDYAMKNFGVRQQARSEEIEALQQAKQILSGASLA